MTARAEKIGEIIGVVLAGGLARRMGGGDKTLTPLSGRPILAHILERLAPQVDGVILNANGDPARFSSFGLPVCADETADHPGPLAGVLSGMTWAARHRPAATHILTAPGDAPFPPGDLAARLAAPIVEGRADLTCAMSDGRRHPVIGLWPVALAADLRAALMDEGVRKVDIWTGRHRCEPVSFEIESVDPFFNINTAQDLAEAEAALGLHGHPERAKGNAMNESSQPLDDVELRLGDLSLGLRPGAGGHISWFRSLPSGRRAAAFDWLRPSPPDSGEAVDAACFPMTPFCNRVDQGRFTYDGRAVSLPKNFPPEEHAIHGLGWRAPWRVAERSADRAVLSFSHDGSVWPWAFETRIAYSLVQTAEGGRCDIRVETINQGDSSMPSGFGLHPYFARREGALIKASVTSVIETDAVMMPRMVVSDSPLKEALTSGDRFPDGFDNALEGWDGVAEIRWPGHGATLILTASDGFPRAVFYSPVGQDYFCFEPVSHTYNGLNTLPAGCGDGGVVRLAPGESHSATLTLTPHLD